jgi:transposase
MERFRTYEPDQQVFTTLIPSENFGRDSFEYFLVTMINDFDVTAFWANPDRGGETPYDPRAMLGIILYGFCQGIFSSRKLEHSCRNNLGFMYVSGHNCPDHAAICRFLKKYDQELKLIYR